MTHRGTTADRAEIGRIYGVIGSLPTGVCGSVPCAGQLPRSPLFRPRRLPHVQMGFPSSCPSCRYLPNGSDSPRTARLYNPSVNSRPACSWLALQTQLLARAKSRMSRKLGGLWGDSNSLLSKKCPGESQRHGGSPSDEEATPFVGINAGSTEGSILDGQISASGVIRQVTRRGPHGSDLLERLSGGPEIAGGKDPIATVARCVVRTVQICHTSRSRR
jgi:hypothetical protein